MAITNYSELLTAVGSTWPRRADLAGMAADFVAQGEAYINRRLRIPEMESATSVSPSQSVRYVALPSRYMEAISFVDDLGDEMQAVDASLLERMAYASAQSRPRFYRIADRIDFDCVADASYNYTLRYYKRLDIASDTTSAVLTAHPDIYRYAALVHAEAYVKNDSRIALWKTSLDEAIRDANRKGKRNLALLRTELPLAGLYDIRADR